MTVRRAGWAVAALLAISVLAIVAGFADFVLASQRKAGPVPSADGIVALTGGADRVETALRLLAAGRAKRLLVSGVGQSAGLEDLARRVELDPVSLAPRVTLGRVATTTRGNAEEAADWARANRFHSLIIVTAGYHMARAMLEMRRSMPDATLYPLPVHPHGSLPTPGLRLLAGEYAKLIGAWVGLSQVMRSPVAWVRHDPVDNSVNG